MEQWLPLNQAQKFPFFKTQCIYSHLMYSLNIHTISDYLKYVPWKAWNMQSLVYTYIKHSICTRLLWYYKVDIAYASIYVKLFREMLFKINFSIICFFKRKWKSYKTQCDFLVNSVLHTATTMADLCRIHRQLIFNICTDSRTFTRIFNKTRVNYKIFFILMQKLESTSFHIKIWHLVELFLIFWHCFLFVYLQIKKAGNLKFYYKNRFIF